MKIVVAEKKAQPARQGINPRTGETIQIAAKPASKVVRVRALKKLKEMI
ncbi:MAG: HU family DNA-binding protein [Planctomycetaceae bacterium]|nr:HU family DNA-binding protein [Planctomycetaceae bacterium]